MGNIKIRGARPLEGTIRVQGAKNSVLPILAASILVKGETKLENCPNLRDVDAAISILEHLGCRVTKDGKTVYINAAEITGSAVPDHLMREMRSSVIFLGAILGRCGEATLSMPGGCELGPRPIDLHIKALKALGAVIEEQGGNIICRAAKLVGSAINLELPSVGATENAILAAVSAEGETVITNAAREPEIVDLADFLIAAGAKIAGAGTSTIHICGNGCCAPSEMVTHAIMPDRIVAATYLSAAALTGGRLELDNVVPEHVATVTDALERAGCIISIAQRTIQIASKGKLCAIAPIITRPYPGFATDAQPCLVAACLKARGTTVFIENIFQNRYRYVEELSRMGADIKLEGRVAIVTGVKSLNGTTVAATDLRGGAALVVAALAAQGETIITQTGHILRGYDDIVGSLQRLGADVLVDN